MIEVYNDDYFMKKALNEAEKAFEEGEIPVGAVVVMNKQIIGRGYNQTEKLNDFTAHAEMIAITSASETLGSKYLQDTTLYVTLEPCVMCGGATAWAQVSRIVYAAKDEKRGCSQYQPSIIHPKCEFEQGSFSQESKKLLQAFFHNKRN